jgi:hypothetical protein
MRLMLNSINPQGILQWTRWKLRTVYDKLNEAYAKFYNPSEHLAVDEIVVKFKGRVIFRQYIPKIRKCFGFKLYKFCDGSRYIYDMSVYLSTDSHSATDDMTATHAVVKKFDKQS